MSPIICGGPIRPRSRRDRVDIVIARANRALYSGFAPLALIAWIALAVAVIMVVLLALAAVVLLLTMAFTGRWEGLGPLGSLLLGGLLCLLSPLVIVAFSLWLNDVFISVFWPQSRPPRKSRAHHVR